MRKPIRIAIVLLLAILALLLLFALALPSEPSYRGHTLKDWVSTYYATYVNSPSSSEFQEANAAIHHIGTNSLFELVKSLEYDHTPRRAKMLRFLWRLPGPILRSPVANYLLVHDPKASRAITACSVLEMLGPEAKPAVPGLTQLMLTTNSITVSLRAMGVLAKIGPEGWEPIQRVMTNSAYPMQKFAIATGRHMGTNAIPTLTYVAQKDPDQTTRIGAQTELIIISRMPDPIASRTPVAQ